MYKTKLNNAAYVTSSSTVLSRVSHKKLFTEFLIQFFTNNNPNAANVI